MTGKLSGAALRVIGSKDIVSINDVPFVELAKLARDAGLNADKFSYGDLLADGVIDPVKVTRSAVLNAASVARMVLTTEAAVVERVSRDEDDHGGHHHGHAH